jgi:hypothetical protein
VTFPKQYSADDAPAEVIALAQRLVPLLIEGEHPALGVLREQYRRARIEEVELSGVGFFVHFNIPSDTPKVEPANFSGGAARIQLVGARHGAGCVLFVRKGRLSMLEGYTYDDEWPENAAVLSVSDVIPIDPTRTG